MLLERLFGFRGGVQPPYRKHISSESPIRVLTASQLCDGAGRELVLPVHQHIGEDAVLEVKIGDRVLKGQRLAKAQGFVSAPVHAPTSGTVTAVGNHAVAHPSGLEALCIHLKPDGKEQWLEPEPVADYRQLEPSALRNLLRNAGIVGLGGAGFPSFIKLNPGDQNVDTLILNGIECEPYITCDHALLREQPDKIIRGARILQHAVHARHIVLAVEDNKASVIASLGQALEKESDFSLAVVPTRYPAGSEKQLVENITGRQVPKDGLPIQVQVVVHNVATAAAIYEAIELGTPLIERVMTLTGNCVRHPGNYRIPLGTVIDHWIEAAGGYDGQPQQLLMGGPMMGIQLQSAQIPVIKTTNCIIAARRGELVDDGPYRPCIRCGACADSCPVNLLPQQLYWYSNGHQWEQVQNHHVFDCIECGCCSYVCPSRIPLVHYFRYAKSEIWYLEREKNRSDFSRIRFEHRQQRLEKEKQEREAKREKRKQALKQTAKPDPEAPADAIEAAVQRSKKRKPEPR